MAYIPGTNGNDDLYSGRNADHLDGGAGDDTLVGNGGDDTLEGGKGNDSLSGGDGSDTFVYANGEGNDTIVDYEEDDVIKITSGTISKISTASNGDVVFKIGTGKITVQNAANKIITYEDPNNERHLYPVEVNAAGTAATLSAAYGKNDFNFADYEDFAETLKNVDASAVKHDMTITGNKLANKITGTSEDDSISGGAGKDTIDGSDGNDTIDGGAGNDLLTGGEGADLFLWKKGDGNDKITDFANEDTIQITGDTVKSVKSSGDDIIFTLAGKNKLTLVGGADKVINYSDETGPYVYPKVYVVNDKGTAVSLLSEYLADTFDVTANADFGTTARTIDGSAVDQDITIIGNKQRNVIIGGDGNNTLDGGKGNDTLTGGTGSNVFLYANGGGNDVITNYKSGDVIQITSGTVSSAGLVGNDYVFTVGKGKITVKDAKNKYIAVTDDNGSYWYPQSPIPQLTYSDGSVTISRRYIDDTFDVTQFEDGFAGKVYNIDASAVTHDISIIGNKEKNLIIGSDGNDTLDGGKGNDSLQGGDGADVFVWNKGGGNDKILDYANEDAIQITGDTVKTVKKSGNDVIFITLAGKNKLTLVGGADKVINYSDDSGSYVYPKVYDVDGSEIKLLAKYSANTFDATANPDFEENIISIDASAVKHDMTITGNKLANNITGTSEDDYISGGAGKDTIDGSDGNDTIEGGAGNDLLTGGDGADVFVWNKGDGNDKILDYDNEDAIKFTGDTVKSIKESGENIIFTLAGKNKITVVGGANKIISYSDDNYPNGTTYPETSIVFNSKNTAATLMAGYTEDSYDFSANGKLISLDASPVNQSISITGNKKANNITGSDNNDTINGGAGNDTLSGGDGADVFVWNKGGGNDKILDYANEDSIQITGDTVKSTKESGNDIIFTLAGKNKITVVGGADKFISYTDDAGEHTYPETPIVFNSKNTAATLMAGYTEDSYDFSANGKLISLDASPVTHSIDITGNKKANNITGSDENDTVSGGAGNDTLAGGKGNDKLYGGVGADVFVWNKGDGNDKILDFENEDSIKITGDTYKTYTTAKNGEDIVLTLTGKNKITITGGVDKVISGTDDNGEFVIGSTISYNEDYTSATLTAGYSKSSFDTTDYSAYVDTLATIDASPVTHSLNIYGSALSNQITGSEEDDYIDGGAGKDVIYGGDGDDTLYGNAGNDKLYGGDGNDSLWGGAGTDTLYGGEGADTFVFTASDGKNVIYDFDSSVDKIIALSGAVALKDVVGTDVVFSIGSGQITVKNSTTQYVEVADSSGNRLAYRNGSAS